jgi:hypothetical protein
VSGLLGAEERSGGIVVTNKAKVGASAGLSYLLILLALFAREMYAVGAGEGTLTGVTVALAELAPWFVLPVMAFLSWLWVHFARRLFPIWWPSVEARVVRFLPFLEDQGRRQVRGLCPGCLVGDAPVLLDEHGTLASVSGLPGRPGHAIDDYWWHCHQYPSPPPWETSDEG